MGAKVVGGRGQQKGGMIRSNILFILDPLLCLLVDECFCSSSLFVPVGG